MMEKRKVVLADVHASVREMTQIVLTLEGTYEVVAHAGNGRDALQACRKFSPELLILDLTLTGLPALEVIRAVRTEQRGMRVLIFSGSHCRGMTMEALRMQPHGFVHKEDALPTFYEALRAVSLGHQFFTRYASRLLDELASDSAVKSKLTAREHSVLQMVAEGRTSKEMALYLAVAPKTIEHYRAQLMEKLNLHDVANLTRYAVNAGMVA